MAGMVSEQDNFFIIRMIDTLRDHTDPVLRPKSEREISSSLWRLTSPLEYYQVTLSSYQDGTDAELRQQISKALKNKDIERVLFLILVIVQLPEYHLGDKDRQPWGWIT